MSQNRISLDELRMDRERPEKGRPLARISILAAIALAAAAGGWFFLWRGRSVEVRTQVARGVEPVQAGPRTVLNGSGYVVARRQATVSSKMTGKVAEVMIEEGFKVEDGQVLARLDAANLEASLRLSEAELAAASAGLAETRALLEEAERELKRMQALATSDVASESELDRADAQAKSLRARLERQTAEVAVADRQVAVWKQQLEDTVIRAPFAGVVVSKNAQPGEMISPISAGGGFTRTGIGTVVDMTSLEIEVDVNESYLKRVRPGQPVEAALDAYPEWKIPSKVIAIIPTADRQKSTVKVRIGFEKLDPRILPEMGVKVAFQEDRAEGAAGGVTVSKAAIRHGKGRDLVLVVAGGRVEERDVTVGTLALDEVTVLAGLAAGERVVVEGPAELAEGDRVRESAP